MELQAVLFNDPQVKDEEPVDPRILELNKRLRKVKHLAAKVVPHLERVSIEQWREASPVDVRGWTPQQQFCGWLAALWGPTGDSYWSGDDILWTGDVGESGSVESTVNFKPVYEWVQQGHPYGQQASIVSFKEQVWDSGCRTKANIARRPYIVLESDTLSREQFGGLVKYLQKFYRLKSLTLTGGKSIHAVFQYFTFPGIERNLFPPIKFQGKLYPTHPEVPGNFGDEHRHIANTLGSDSPEAKAMWAVQLRHWRRLQMMDGEEIRQQRKINEKHHELYAALIGMGADPQVLRHALTTRCPGAERKDDGGNFTGRIQELIYLNDCLLPSNYKEYTL